MTKKQKLRLSRVCRWITRKMPRFPRGYIQPSSFHCIPKIAEIYLQIGSRASIADVEIKANPTQKALKRLALARLECTLYDIRTLADEQMEELKALREQL